MSSILELNQTVSELEDSQKELFHRFYSVSVNEGKLKIPDEMKDWVKDTFGPVEDVENQKIVRVNNKLTQEASMFNQLRSMRPKVKSDSDLKSEIEDSQGGPFCNAKEMTPEDSFGRIEGDHCVTASNVAKYDHHHGLIISDNHDPLDFDLEHVRDYIQTANKWLEKSHEEDSDAVFPYVFWHCLWKSAASIIHGHMQLTLTSDSHYPYFERLNHVRQDYITNYGTTYFQDLYQIHESLNLGFEKNGVKVMAHLTPKKEKEILLVSESANKSFADSLYNSLACLRDDFGVHSFTVAIGMPPLVPQKGWESFPVIARIIDRGSLSEKTGDIGAMELFADSSVVSSDPFEIIDKLKESF